MQFGGHVGRVLRRRGILYAGLAVVAAGALVLTSSRQKQCDCVVLIGDSITSKWASLSNQQLSGLHVINRGIPGDSTSHMLSRFRRDVIQLHPRVVVILGGINDIPETPLPTIESRLTTMAESAARHRIRVVLATLPPAGVDNPDQPTSSHPSGHDEIRTLNDWIKSLANQGHYTLVDYDSVLSEDRGFYRHGLTSDGVHPSVEGYALMEPLLRQAIQSALNRTE